MKLRNVFGAVAGAAIVATSMITPVFAADVTCPTGSERATAPWYCRCYRYRPWWCSIHTFNWRSW